MTELPEIRVLPQTVVDKRLLKTPATTVLDGAVSYLNVQASLRPGFRPLRVDIHLPDSQDGPFPVVVYAHGGGFIGGVKEMGPWGPLPACGIAVVSVEYRLAGESRFPGPVDDLHNVVEWIGQRGETYSLDSSRLVMWGSSAGAYLTACAVCGIGSGSPESGPERLTSGSVRAMVLHYPPLDFSHILRQWDDHPDRTAQVRASMQALFGEPDPTPEFLRKTSVIEAVRQGVRLPPVHLSHGDADTVVPVEESLTLYEELRQRNIPSELCIISGEGHATAAFSTWDTVSPTVNFIRASLQLRCWK